MFVVSDIRKLRVYVNIPQSYVPAIKIGAKAVMTVPDYPNRTFPATVEASSQSVDVSSGTTRMQLGLDNSSGELMPGSYANVRMSLARDTVPLHIPASALIFNQNGLRVATVGPDDKVLFKTVTIGRDLGREIELASGITPEDRIIVAPPDGIADGDPVRVVGAGGAAAPKGKPKRFRKNRTSRGRRRRAYCPTRHSITPSSAVTIAPVEPTGVRSMFIRCLSVGVVAGRYPRQCAGIGLRSHHHYAMLDVAVAAIEHGKTLDRALAAGFRHELRHLAAVAVGLGLHAGVLGKRCLRRFRDSTRP